MMLDKILQNPSLRVFCVDRECYVLFIGNRASDRRAFLRIGSSTALPPAVHNHIEGLVCTPVPLGDIVAEREYLAQLSEKELPYFLGTPEVLKRYKRFFRLDKVLGAKYQPVKGQSTVHRGAFLYYSGSDQIEVMLNNHCLFSLRKQAVSDALAPQRNIQIGRTGAQYSRSYNLTNLPSTGFFVVQSDLYLYHHGRIFAVDPHANPYEALITHGFDGRLINEGLHSQVRPSFLSTINNSALRQPPRRWYFYDPQKTLDRQDIDALIQFANSKVTTRFLETISLRFPAFSLEKSDDEPYALRFERHLRCAIDIAGGAWVMYEDDSKWRDTLIPNIPYSFSFATQTSVSQLLRDYLPAEFESGTHHCASSETALLNSCLRFITAQTVERMKLQYTQMQRTGRKLSSSCQLLTRYALHNIRTIMAAQLADYEERQHQQRIAIMKQAIKWTQTILQRVIMNSSSLPPLPAEAVILHCVSGAFIQLIRYDWNRDYRHVERDLSVREQIAATIAGAGPDFYRAERQRLCRLLVDMEGDAVASEIRELAGPEPDPEPELADAPALAATTRKKKRKRVRIRAYGTPRVPWMIVIIVLAVLIALLVLFIALGTRGASSPDESTATAPVSTTADATRTALEERITAGAFTDSSFTTATNSTATLLSETYVEISSPLGTVAVTVDEVIRLVNTIARANGFREIGAEDIAAGRDPNLIYPFTQLSLPSSSDPYRVAANDSIWLVAVSLIEAQVQDFLSQLAEIDIITQEMPTAEIRAVLREKIDGIIADSYTASLVAIANRITEQL